MFLKQLGYSLDEIREMTMTQFMVLTDLATGSDDKADPISGTPQPEEFGVRKATQADIDNFFSF